MSVKRCIFCKQDSGTSVNVEHIIPEAFGNKEHILPAGVVCDTCNNYFGLKIEKPLLDSHYFRHVRFRNRISNKEGTIPTIEAYLLPNLMSVEIMVDKMGKSIFASKEKDTREFIHTISSKDNFSLIFPAELPQPDDRLVSRFLGKVGIEVLAHRFLDIPEGLNEVIDKPELDELRDYTRFGNAKKNWPYHRRRIYPEGKIFYKEDVGEYEVLHEFNLLYTESCEIYLVAVIFGIEYSINLGGPELDGYLEWLKKHDNRSPLYSEI